MLNRSFGRNFKAQPELDRSERGKIEKNSYDSGSGVEERPSRVQNNSDWSSIKLQIKIVIRFFSLAELGTVVKTLG